MAGMTAVTRPHTLGPWRHRLMLTGLCFLLHLTHAMERVVIADDGQGFQSLPSHKAFVPWGHNSSCVNLLERMKQDPAAVKKQWLEMKAAGTNVIRIHPEMPRILRGPDEIDTAAMDHIKALLALAEETGMYLKITGLACYNIKDRMPWYDAMKETERWKTQAFFWQTIARSCAKSPAVFAYDLVNEPAGVGKVDDGWYMGKMGDVEFCQRLSLDAGNRKADEIMSQWTQQMVAAIRSQDRDHLITMGMLPFPEAYRSAARHLDFVSPHLYPKTGKVEDELALLARFRWGKPIVIGETFPLTCGINDLRQFLLRSREHANGWLGQWPDESPHTLRAMKTNGTATLHSAIWLSWVDLFEELGEQMNKTSVPRESDLTTDD